MPTTAHSSVLDDVRRALRHVETVSPAPLEPFSELSDENGSASLVSRFVQEAKAVRAQVYPVADSPQLVEKIIEICASQPGEIALSGAAFFDQVELLTKLVNRGVATTDTEGNHEALISRLANCAVGITAAEYAIAETGTIVLTSDEPNALLVSLLPPVHIVVVRADQMILSLDEAIRRLSKDRLERENPSRSITMITGPSRTSDVELVLSIGVHGPKELHAIIFD